MSFRTANIYLLLALCIGLIPQTTVHAARPGLDITELMKVRKVFGTVVSDDGGWVALEARPGRGDGEVIVKATRSNAEHRIDRGQAAQLSSNGAWVAALRLAPFAERETAEPDDQPKPGAVLLSTADARERSFERVKAFGFSDDGAWFALQYEAPEASESEQEQDPAEKSKAGSAEEPSGAPEASPDEGDEASEPKPRESGTQLVLIRLADEQHFEFAHVLRWGFDPTSAWIAIAVATEDGQDNRLEVRSLERITQPVAIAQAANAAFPAMSWAEEQPLLAFLQGDEAEAGTVAEIELHVVSPAVSTAPESFTAEEGWEFPAENELQFSRDGARVFAGLRPSAPTAETDPLADTEAEPEFDPFDAQTILADRGVDVWHWKDPRIKSHEKVSWKQREKHLFRAVAHRGEARLTRLAGPDLPEVSAVHNPRTALGRSDVPWLELLTWDGFYQDVYVVDLQSGERTMVVEKTQDSASLSPLGGFVAYYRPDGEGQWWLYDVARAQHRWLAAPVAFADEDHDYPRTPTEYGIAGWADDDSSVLIYDKYDVWSFDTSNGAAVCLTEGRGRSERRIYRVLDLEPEIEGFSPDAELLLSGFDERGKSSSFWSVPMNRAGLSVLRSADKRFDVIAKARAADVLIYTEERYDEFPDLWTADTALQRARKLTDVNPQLRSFDLGRAELVEWSSADGIALQGVLIKPANYDPKRRYPVLVYFYRFFSQRLHEFNDPQVNHRPSFPVYAGDGYAVFLPDVRFEIGEPGSSATRCLVPGVQKLIEIGVADPDAVALHGHSWSGYQAAHVITQTDLFACAVAGAPVSNMVSAYGGIRYGTGLARQFQYEKSQSRLGASLWERRDLYIENSPLFYADRIRTPLLIQFGDVDEAVPWTQGIELYLAMRRLDKPCVMLQYRDEPHHLQKYANKLDYSLRMKEFIDHFCKGSPAPQWWVEGEPYAED